MKTFEWTDATSVEQALGQLDQKAILKAGGVDVLDLLKEHLIAPDRLVNIRNIRELDYVRHDDQSGLKLGPLVTLHALSEEPVVLKQYTAIAHSAGHAATPQIRNMATLGGNLVQRPRCWYFRNEEFHCRKKGGELCYAHHGENQYHSIFDNTPCAIVHPSSTATALVAYHATIELTSSKGKKEVALEDFFTLPEVDVHRENNLAPGQIITEIRVPAQPANSRSVYIKQGEKESQDWPIADVAVVMERDGDRCKNVSIVLGAAAPVPHRAKEAEDAVKGKKIDDKLAHDAARAALADAEPLALNGYKVPLFETIIRRALLACAGDEEASS